MVPASDAAVTSPHEPPGWMPDERAAMTIAFLWGLAEATLFFIVPDVWIGLLALFSLRRGLHAAVWALAGAIVGGALMYGIGASIEPDRSTQILDAVPAISVPMIEDVERQMRDQGTQVMTLGPLRGTPYKIYARTAGLRNHAFAGFVLWTVPARIVRFLLSALLVSIAANLARRFLRQPGWITGLYAVFWIVFYGSYFAIRGV